ncbi:hypothetical protein [Aquibacillus sediminis]|uniref:hypothetical protein n=1 Tax=Aquibacillus sediminis TaxID=2574734 RepID=UPI0011089F90|nr:hypothetical protein [Aquibacillus sediminis]
MNFIRIITGVATIGIVFYHFFIDQFYFPEMIFSALLTILFLFGALDYMKDKKRVLGSIYIVAALISCSVVVKELFTNFS